VDVLIHAAGLEISRRLADKRPEEFDLVFDVKADGWFNLLSNLGQMPLGATVAFGSVAGRFGNAGQTDYSAANDLLAKLASSLRATHPATRAITIDWTAWGGIGMATRGSIPAALAEAGIDLLPPEDGIPVVRRELTAGDAGTEIVVAGRLGAMTDEFDPTGGLDLGGVAARGPLLGAVTGMGLYSGLTVETDLDPSRQPFLFDHRIAGTPVLPGVMGIEALAEAASLLFPDLEIAAVEEVRFLAPFKFHRDQPRRVTLRAELGVEHGGVVARCRLVGTRTLHGRTEPEVTTHFTARVRLSPAAEPRRGHGAVPPPSDGRGLSSEAIYRVYFHGPAYQVVDRAWRVGPEFVARLRADLPANHEPSELPLVVGPRLIELCFQTAGLAELAAEGRMGLPSGVGRIEFHWDPQENGPLHAVVTRRPDGAFDGTVVDDEGNVVLLVEEYRTTALPDAVDPSVLRPIRDALS
jgi:hypothetical protein